MKPFEVPIAFIIFNRPDNSQKVFDEIRKVRPKRLFVISDGPRHEAEKKTVEETRKIIEQVDWDCEVKKNYSDKNLGCKMRVVSGLNWFFGEVECGIVLEDDCVPSHSFFPFCEELLEKYKDNERVMMITGDNFQFGDNAVAYDYYFSRRFFHLWGWASWRRAWNHYDIDMKKWPAAKAEKTLDYLFETDEERENLYKFFDVMYRKEIDTWDYQWTLACMLNKGVCAIPNINLVSNIGFGTRATHTHNPDTMLANIPRKDFRFPLKHPPEIIFNKEADRFTLLAGRKRYSSFYILKRAAGRIKRLLWK